MVKPIDEIRTAGATLAMHINYGDGYGYVYRSVSDPRLTISVTGPKGRKSKRQRSTTYTTPDGEFLTIEEAWESLRKRDQVAEDDVAWDAAAPRSKPAAIEGFP